MSGKVGIGCEVKKISDGLTFTAFKLLIPIFLRQSLQRPLRLRLPAFLQACDDDGLVVLLEPIDELLTVHVRCVNPLDVVLKLSKIVKVDRVVQLAP